MKSKVFIDLLENVSRRRVLKTKSADNFYELMGVSCQNLLQMSPAEANDLMQVSVILKSSILFNPKSFRKKLPE